MTDTSAASIYDTNAVHWGNNEILCTYLFYNQYRLLCRFIFNADRIYDVLREEYWRNFNFSFWRQWLWSERDQK